LLLNCKNCTHSSACHQHDTGTCVDGSFICLSMRRRYMAVLPRFKLCTGMFNIMHFIYSIRSPAFPTQTLAPPAFTMTARHAPSIK
jgi:hypothetical protein